MTATPTVRQIPVADIEPAAYNPRVPATEGTRLRADLERSLDEFGLVIPLVWNQRTGRLVGGHQRFAVLVAQGATEIPCAVVDLPDKAEIALNLALNRISGEWVPDKLTDTLTDLAGDETLTTAAGFTTTEIESLRQLAKLDAQLDGLKPDNRRVDTRTDTTTDRDAPSPVDFPPSANLTTTAELPARLRRVAKWITAWQNAVRTNPTDFANRLRNRNYESNKNLPDQDPTGAAVAVQHAIERLTK